MIQQLVYISEATQPFSYEELITLLENAQNNNKILNITGILLFDSQRTFLQVLEGSQENVQNLLSKIKQDPRHTNVLTVHVEEIYERTYNNWSMGLKQVETKRFHVFIDACLSDQAIRGMPRGLVGRLIKRFITNE